MDEDMILPEGFEDTPTTEPAVEQEQGFEEPVEQTEEVTTPTETPTEPQEPVIQPQTIKVKFNHQEMELSAEEAATLAQKGMAFDKAVERARTEAAQQARDAVIAEMGYTWNGKPITTEAEYKHAVQEQELINKYKDRDLPEEVIHELLESRRDREERQREKSAKEEEAKVQTQYNEFFQTFQALNERAYDANKDTLPQEVWDAVKNGQPLKYAYLEHYNKELRNQLKISKQNEANMKKAPVGSVTAGGGTKTESKDPFLEGFDSI